jgi:ABC-type sugar transport system ATPase subunit
MLGRAASTRVPHSRQAGDEVMRASGVHVPGHLEDLEIGVRAGEILGIAGLVGSGRSELLRALAGMDPASSGTLAIGGGSVRWPRDPRQALRAGIALVPEDRKAQGLVLGMPVFDNINIPAFASVSSHGVLRRGRSSARRRTGLARGAQAERPGTTGADAFRR